MANPQKENGYTAVANEILERLVKTPLLGSEFQVLFCIIRKTYGWGKKSDIISYTQFENHTGLSRPTISKTLKNLMARNMIVKVCLPDDSIEYTFIKDHEKWVVNTAKLVKNNSKTSKDRLTRTSKDRLTYKRKIKETKEISEDKSSQDIPITIKAFETINPACSKMYGNKNQRAACQDLIDTYGLERILTIISETLPKTNKLPYFPTITTPIQLRDKFSQLESAILKKRSESLQIKDKYKII